MFIVCTAEVVGKRVRYRLDGSKILKVRRTTALLQGPCKEPLSVQFKATQTCVVCPVARQRATEERPFLQPWVQSMTGCCNCVQVYLDPKDRNTTEYKLETFVAVYQ